MESNVFLWLCMVSIFFSLKPFPCMWFCNHLFILQVFIVTGRVHHWQWSPPRQGEEEKEATAVGIFPDIPIGFPFPDWTPHARVDGQDRWFCFFFLEVVLLMVCNLYFCSSLACVTSPTPPTSVESMLCVTSFLCSRRSWWKFIFSFFGTL